MSKGVVVLNIPEFKGKEFKEAKARKMLIVVAVACIMFCGFLVVTTIMKDTYIEEQRALIEVQDAYIKKEESYIKLLEYKLKVRAFIPEIRTDLLDGLKR